MTKTIQAQAAQPQSVIHLHIKKPTNMAFIKSYGEPTQTASAFTVTNSNFTVNTHAPTSRTAASNCTPAWPGIPNLSHHSITTSHHKYLDTLYAA